MLQLSPNTPNVGHSLCLRLQELTTLYIALKQSLCFLSKRQPLSSFCGEINFNCFGLSGKQAVIGLIMFLKIKKNNMRFKCADGSVISHGLEKELHYILLLVTYYFLWLLLSAGGSG